MQQTLDELISKLNDPLCADPARLVEALEKMGAPAIDPLCRALEHKNWFVRSEAADALGRIGHARAVEPLKRIAQSDHEEVRLVALKALGRIGKPAVKTLRLFLDSASEVIRSQAIEQLSEIGSSASAMLLDALKDPQGRVRDGAAQALGDIQDAYTIIPLCHLLPDHFFDIRSVAGDALAQMEKKRSLARLTLAANMRPIERLDTLNTIKQFQSKLVKLSSLSVLPDVLPFCQEHLSDPDEKVRQGAREVLALFENSKLLRGSDGAAKQELLRSTPDGAGEETPESLLRPSSSEETSNEEQEEPQDTSLRRVLDWFKKRG